MAKKSHSAKFVASAVPAAVPALGWDQGIARQIALDNTGVASATLWDELDGQKIGMISQDVRVFYRDACCRAAKQLGHPVSNPESVHADAGTTVMDVGDSLYAAAKP